MIKKAALLFASVLLISGCNKNTKKILGLVETMPDEYQVKRNKSLEVPPSYQLDNAQAKKKESTLSAAEQAVLQEAK